MSLVVDTCWLGRYQERTQHPADDAEKVTVRDGESNSVPVHIGSRDVNLKVTRNGSNLVITTEP